MNVKLSRVRAVSATAAAAILCVSVTGCTRTETTNTVVENSVSYENGPAETATIPGGDSGDGGGWSVTSERDAITDELVNKAVRSLASGDFTIEVSIACGSRHLATYEFAAFDRADEVQPLRWQEKGVAIVNAVIAYDLRLDGGPPQSRFGYGRKYSNVFTIGAESLGADYAAAMASAQNIVMRFGLINDDATIQWDQTDPELRRMLAPCVKSKTPPPVAAQPLTDQPAEENDEPSATDNER